MPPRPDPPVPPTLAARLTDDALCSCPECGADHRVNVTTPEPVTPAQSELSVTAHERPRDGESRIDFLERILDAPESPVTILPDGSVVPKSAAADDARGLSDPTVPPSLSARLSDDVLRTTIKAEPLSLAEHYMLRLRRCLDFVCMCGDTFSSVEEFSLHVDLVHDDDALGPWTPKGGETR